METMKRNRKKTFNRTVGFRLEDDFARVFDEQIEALGVSESELARKAARYGLKFAVEEIAKQKRKEAEAMLAKLNRGGGSFESLSALLTTKARRKWCAVEVSNLRPLPCQS